MRYLSNPTANLPTMRVLARALHHFGPMDQAELATRVRPEWYRGKFAPIDESLSVGIDLGVLAKSAAAQPKWQVGPALNGSSEWFDDEAWFRLRILRSLNGQTGEERSDISRIIPRFMAQGWRATWTWNEDPFIRQHKLIKAEQPGPLLDRWLRPLGLATNRLAPDPTRAMHAVLATLHGRGAMTGAEFLAELSPYLCFGPAHALAETQAPGEDAPVPGLVFASVGFGLRKLAAAGVIRLDHQDDASEEDRILYRDGPNGGQAAFSQVEAQV